ncbi:ABC transporter ATP-binding protein/permease [Mariniplasma anaerobium]|uniref:Sulfate ABC transporter ATP-binding protein n=1 Tax=Mariniplasma anaerobium TaxID=2735436 RepID=A0A7U9TIB9_9MOLU|nr:ABC transporter ATP-binding protein/permease [Mariniplasma anaerobium]BCR35925.1 sulfate ABC transporter ATP-binding protein [Mariniplasma anaerobium]
MAMIKLDQVSKYYRSEDTVSVGMKNISLEFELGEFVAVTGESGSGKSTLLNVISGLDGYEDGELFLFGEETSHYTIADWERYRGTYIGFVFQSYNIIDSYTVYQNVMLALEIQGYDKHKRKQRALELIDQVGLTSHKNHKASKLSGGQKQRAVIARALAKDCPVIVADEPTGNLDSKSAEQVMDLLFSISKNKLVIVVTHDYSQVQAYATRKIKMHDGEVVEDKPIKKPEKVEPGKVIQPKRMPFLSLLRFAVRNLLATPKKLFFLMIMQILVIGVFTIVYTNQISNIREIGLEQSSVYPSVPETRLIVEKRDGTAFTAAEIEELESNRRVEAVYPNAMNFYNETSLYVVKENQFEYGRANVDGTDSVVSLSQRDVDGELPVLANEIVMSANYDFNVGDTVVINVGNAYYWQPEGASTISVGTFVVSGIDKQDRDIIYFSEAYLNQPSANESLIDYQKLSNLSDRINYELMINFDGDQMYGYRKEGTNITEDILFDGGGTRTILTNQTIQFSIYDVNYQSQISMTLTGLTLNVPEEIYYGFTVNQNTHDDIRDYFLTLLESTYTIEPKQYVSVSVSGFYAGNRLLNTLDSDAYKIYYPANISGAMREIQVFFASFLAVILLTLFGMFLYSIVHAVTKNVMNARKKDFAIYRSIGANKATLAQLVVIEQVMMSTIGFAITILLITVLSNNIYVLTATIKYMEVKDYFILLGAFMFFGAWLGLRFNKKVFNQSVIETLTQSRGE